MEPIRRDEHLLVVRLRTGFWIVLLVTGGFAVLDVMGHQPRLGLFLSLKAAQCAVLLAGIFALPRIREGRRTRLLGALTVGAVYALSGASGFLREDFTTTGYLFVAATMATATFVPWGGGAQLFTAAVAGVTILVQGVLVPVHHGDAILYPAFAVLMALLGSAWIAREHELRQIQRQRAEIELGLSRARLEEESMVSGVLARVGQEMIASINAPVLSGRICELTNEVLGCDFSVIALRDAAEDVLVPDSSRGLDLADWEDLRYMRIPAASMALLLENLDEGDTLQVDTRDIADAIAQGLHRRFGVSSSLYVPLHRGSDLVGILAAHHRRVGRSFSRLQERLAAGIARVASMALENARLVEELRSANQLKSEFVSTMSHELRTPVSVILGYTEILDEEPSPAERAAVLARVRRSAIELLDLIEETLNVNRLEGGKDPPRFERVAVRDLFDELAMEFRALLPQDAVALRWDGPDRAVAWSDPRKLRIIVKNLVGNALKFTSAGEVAVEFRREPERLNLVVRDTGIGIAPEHLPIIFDMFRQADSSDARSYRGAGLGLYIVRRLVAQLGGDISVESEPGLGSVFTVTLPQIDVMPAWQSDDEGDEGEEANDEESDEENEGEVA